MDVMTCLRTRLTVRTFLPDPVPDGVVTDLLQAARWAPSSRNLQPWHFVVVRERSLLQQIGETATSGRFISGAPLAIAVVMDKAERPGVDAGRVIQQMELAAWDRGLSTCFVGLKDVDQNRKIKELLDIPPHMELITVLPFGYRPPEIKGAGKDRKPLRDIAHSEKFGRPYTQEI